jgi:hypothetical protein
MVPTRHSAKFEGCARARGFEEVDFALRAFAQVESALRILQFEDAAISLTPGSLTPGRLNAVRAAFRAGVTPSRIARQLGISHSGVLKALAGSLSKSAEP